VPLPQLQRPRTKTALDRHTSGLVKAIDKAVEKVLHRTLISNKARGGWTDECSQILAETKRPRRARYRDHAEESWEAYCATRNTKARTIKRALQKAHREKVVAVSNLPEAL
jgi:hypothetical protein